MTNKKVVNNAKVEAAASTARTRKALSVILHLQKLKKKHRTT